MPGVPLTVKGLLAWLRTTPRLDVSAPRPGTIGRSLPATVVDVTIAKGAKNEDPTCPTRTCVDFLGYPQWDVNFGISEPQIQRFYLSNVTYGGRKHLFIAVIYPNDPPRHEQLPATRRKTHRDRASTRNPRLMLRSLKDVPGRELPGIPGVRTTARPDVSPIKDLTH